MVSAADDKPDELEKFFGQSDTSPPAKKPGEFTRIFFGTGTGQPQEPDGVSAHDPGETFAPDLEPASDAQRSVAPSSQGEFTRLFGSLNADAPPPLTPMKPQLQNETQISEPGTLAELFAYRNQGAIKPLDPESTTFTRLFSNEASAEQGKNPEKATRLVSPPKGSTDRLGPLAGPSPYTQVINSSALRSAQENAQPDPAAPSNSSPAAQAPSSPPLSQPTPSAWPIGNVATPQMHPSPYLPPQAFPVQMSMPPVVPVVLPQNAPFPAATPAPAPQAQVPPSEQTTEQKIVAYLPLIIGLNLLFFLAVLLILLFALWR